MCASLTVRTENCMDLTPRFCEKAGLPENVIGIIADYCLFAESESDSKRAEERESCNGYKLLIESHVFSSPLVKTQAFERENTFHQIRVLQGFMEMNLAAHSMNTRVTSLFIKFKQSIVNLAPYPLHKMIDFRHTGELIVFAASLNPNAFRECKCHDPNGPGYHEQSFAYPLNPLFYAIEKNHLFAAISIINTQPLSSRTELATQCLRAYVRSHLKTLKTLQPIRMLIENGANAHNILHDILESRMDLFDECLSLSKIDFNGKNRFHETPLDILFKKFQSIEFFPWVIRELILELLTAGADICQADPEIVRKSIHCVAKAAPQKDRLNVILEHAFYLKASDASKIIFFGLKCGMSEDRIDKLIMRCPEMSLSLLREHFRGEIPKLIYKAVNWRMEKTSLEEWEKTLGVQATMPPDFPEEYYYPIDVKKALLDRIPMKSREEVWSRL